MKAVDLTNVRFGRLVAVEKASDQRRGTYWLCTCDCGNSHVASRMALRGGSTKSCGCMAAEQRVDRTSTLPACQRTSSKYPKGRTGTQAGSLAHYYIGELPCKECREGSRQHAAEFRKENPETTLRTNLWQKHHLTLERYLEILAEQGGKCAICLTDAPRDIRSSRFHVDHDHACCPTRKTCGQCIRGLLCHACNTALGNFADDRERLRRAINYLDRSNSESIPA